MKDFLMIAKKALDEKFGEDIVMLDLSRISSITDYFMITNGKSANQIDALSDEVVKKLEQSGYPLLSKEGHASGWILLDFGFMIIHIFDKETRAFFNLERIWSDATVIRE